MQPASRDQDMVTRTKITLSFAFDPQTRRAGEKQDPFIMILIIWFICWRGLPSGDDPLDPYALSHEQLCHDLLVRASGNVMEKLIMGRPSRLARV